MTEIATKKRVLGRGLSALIGEGTRYSDTPSFNSLAESTAESTFGSSNGLPDSARTTATVVQMLNLTRIRPNPRQPRTIFDQETLADLAASILTHGILQPIIVTADLTQPDCYWLVAGERRWRAARMAGLQEIPAIIRESSSRQLMEWALIENLQRADLNPLEEAAAYHSLMNEFAMTQAEVAARIGKSRSAIANLVRLLHLPPSAQQALSEGQISEGHARALLALPDTAAQEEALRQVLAGDLTVRATEALVKNWAKTAAQSKELSPPLADEAQAENRQLENRFRYVLGTKVNLNRKSDGSGHLVVHFYSNEDLEAIYRVITRNDPQDTD